MQFSVINFQDHQLTQCTILSMKIEFIYLQIQCKILVS